MLKGYIHHITACMIQERLFLFRELICKDVDWTGLGIPAYSCFNAFFKRIWDETVTAAPLIVSAHTTPVEAASTVSPLTLPEAQAAPAAPAPAAEPLASTRGVVVGGGAGGPAVTLPPGAAPPIGGVSVATVMRVAPSAPPVEEDLAELGVDTLWRVTLTSLNKEVADNATLDLLGVREERDGCLTVFAFWLLCTVRRTV